jgi:hypothetical protein
MKEYPEDTFTSFGLSIFDECHHLGAEVFHKAMAKVSSKYMLGLSATPNRKDGLRKVFEWYIGPIVYMTKDKNADYIETRIQEYYSEDPAYCKSEVLWNGKTCMPRMINNICGHKDRRDFINQLILTEFNLGRKILILSDRREYLDQTMRYLHETTQLNTIVLASPKSDVVQSVGRILREKAEVRKFHPLVIDIKDTHPNLRVFEKQCDKRVAYYKRENHDITLISIDGTRSKIEKNKRGRKKKEVYDMDYLLDD